MERPREKRRGANYTEEEKEFFLHVIKQYSSIIDSKKTDSETIKQKKEAWKTIALLYNQVAKTGHRDWEQLRTLYDNIKRKKKKSLSEGNNTKPAEEINYIEVIKDEIVPIEDDSSEEQIIPAEREIMSVDEQIMSSEEQVLSNEEQAIFTGEQILPTTETELVLTERKTVSNKELVLPEQELQPAPNQEKCTSLKTSAAYENMISMRYPELNVSTRFDYLQRRRQLFKRTMSIEDLKLIYLRKQIQNANLKRQILIAEHKMQMKIFKAQLRKLKE